LKIRFLRSKILSSREKSFTEIGKEIGLSRETARKIGVKALKKLRDPLRSEKLRDYFE